MKSKVIIGSLFILAFIASTTYKTIRYGVGDALWFCDAILVIVGIGLLFNSQKIMSIALLQCIVLQTPWFINTYSYIFLGYHILGSSTYIFTGGHPLIDFIISMRHFIIMPFLIGYFVYHKFNSNLVVQTIGVIVVFSTLIALSLLFSYPEQNINCAYGPCFEFLPEFNNHAIYILFFLISLIVIHLVLAKPVDWLLEKTKSKQKLIITIIAAIALLSIVAATATYVAIPKYTCSFDDQEHISCAYVDPLAQTVTLQIKNKGSEERCYKYEDIRIIASAESTTYHTVQKEISEERTLEITLNECQ